jgi:beta-phosphoglucomutase-like phosphatase (HAD superfamily)
VSVANTNNTDNGHGIGGFAGLATTDFALQGVLFDLDGTLVDTEPYWIAAEYALVEAHGCSWDDTHAHALVGGALTFTGAYIRDHGVDMTVEQIIDSLMTSVIGECAKRMPWRPGARELLRQLRAEGVPCAMVTMSYERLARAVADQLEPGTFVTLVTGDQLTNGKPHPEAYLTAAARLGVDPSRCVAIEDSPTGVASAEAAGCVVVAVPNQVPVKPAETRIMLATLVGVDVGDLRAMVAGITARR